MATKCNKEEYRRCFVRLEIGVSAQFKVQTHQEVTYENLRNYFSNYFPANRFMNRIIDFIDDAKATGCKLIGYCNPLSSHSIAYAEFEVDVPLNSLPEFESKYARYSYLY